MANEDKKNQANRKIQNIAAGIQSNMDSLYQTTYFSSPQASNDIKNLSQDINDNIDKIVSRNMNTMGMPTMSILFSRLLGDSKANADMDLSSMFENPMMMDDMYATYMGNRYLEELDAEIDNVCKYMPDLEEALNVKKDAVLSADHFSKDFLNVKYPTDITSESFAQRITELKKKYKLQQMAEEIYDDTAKYGEKFVYIVPYATAISKLLAQKPDVTPEMPYGLRAESGILTESQIKECFSATSHKYLLKMDQKECRIISESEAAYKCSSPSIITESVVKSYTGAEKGTKFESNPILGDGQSFNLGIEIDESGMIESAVIEAAQMIRVKSIRQKSLKESFAEGASFHEAMPQAKGNLNFNNVLKNKQSEVVSDGLIGTAVKGDPDSSKFKVKVPGAVVKYLKRKSVIPLYIDDTNLGYYYIELKAKDDSDTAGGFRNLLGDNMMSMGGASRTSLNSIDSARQEETIKYVAGQLSRFIDKKFVNMNQDLSKEIYEILKFNDLFNTPSLDMIKISFIPPEDIHHSYFVLDEDLHRGISDLARGLIPAKLYASLYVTNTIGIMTRGQDKRVYYVKQMAETNIAQTLMTVINQIKQGNFGIRQFNSINNVLNITGKFNDYIIPRSSSGDDPISVDVISGQQFDVHTDLMDVLKEMAIDSTGVPLEIIQTRQSVDYASQLSMSSSKFLRTVYKRQERFQNIMSPIISAIYNYEYGENVNLEVTFPPPVFLDMANTNQLITNTKDFVDSIIDVEMPNEDDAIKSKYRQNLFMHYIGTHIDISAHKNILDQTLVQIKEEQKESEVASAESPSDSGGDYY